MGKKEGSRLRFWSLGSAGLALVLILIGSFLDLPIMEAVYVGENAYSLIFGLIGSLPLYLIALSGVVLLDNYFKKSKQFTVRFLGKALLFLVPAVLGILVAIQSLDEYTGSLLASALIAVPLAYLALLLWWFLLKDVDPSRSLDAGIALLLVAALTFAMTHLAKEVAERPRYFFLKDYGTNHFRDWWEWGSGLKDLYSDLSSDWFKSWPSGHSCCASAALLLPIPLSLGKKTRRLAPWVYPAGLLWWAMTALGRMLDGHHFLTDVAFALLFTALLIFLVAVPLLRRTEEEEGEPRRAFCTFEHRILRRRADLSVQGLDEKAVRKIRAKRGKKKTSSSYRGQTRSMHV